MITASGGGDTGALRPPGEAPVDVRPHEGPAGERADGRQAVPAAPDGRGKAPADAGSASAAAEPARGGRFLAKAALVTAALSVAGSLLGLARDQALAHFFGAGTDTDAFLVAWTVPEMAATLLIEDGLAFFLVPAFSLALAQRGRGAGRDPVRALVTASLPRMCLCFTAAALALALAAPWVVAALAPGLPDQRLAVDCTRLTATCAFSFGLAGYCSAALRAHQRYTVPALIYVVYNAAIIATLALLAARWGVRAAAAGVALGGALMVVAQVPSLWRQLRRDCGTDTARTLTGPTSSRLRTTVIWTVLLFALCRQSQVLIERFLASSLPGGAISHLNYAQKVAQMPMALALMLCTVTFPVLARWQAEGQTLKARDRVERDVVMAGCVVLLGAAAVIAGAHPLIQLLFERGAFTPEDTAATASVMRVYSLGLLGHTLVGALARSYFAGGRVTWAPLTAMGLGIVATAGLGVLSVGTFGVYGIAAANAIGISLTATLLLRGMGPRTVPIRIPKVVAELAGLVIAATVATLLGALCARSLTAPVPALLACGPTVFLAFVLVAWFLRVGPLVSAVSALGPALRKLASRHDR
ncbi:putative peptidoglycan biosynthesis protein MurJ [Streptomyces sp. YIM 121038]|uniref:murein biosynthesis integral membrane protein MurJ n=1 Tax=Streptomyces sp. YIM 121038 TaxID=2136401 RepID=UPI0011104198|nr:lipid II flippase MurJ [Streptomyces sp. YIM 121038]QCX77902.1 putative peptidoglycan biosynthesis protein MurJ [Streptomyces sp. YIM 121038]